VNIIVHLQLPDGEDSTLSGSIISVINISPNKGVCIRIDMIIRAKETSLKQKEKRLQGVIVFKTLYSLWHNDARKNYSSAEWPTLAF